MMCIRLLVNYNICAPVVVIVVLEIILMISIVTLSAIWDIVISVYNFSFDAVV